MNYLFQSTALNIFLYVPFATLYGVQFLSPLLVEGNPVVNKLEINIRCMGFLHLCFEVGSFLCMVLWFS